MANDLERYNHLRRNGNSSPKDEFIDFLYEQTNISAPEINVDDAWNRLNERIYQSKRPSYGWLKIAASVALLIGAVFFIWNLANTPEQLTISSNNEKISVTFPDGSIGVLNRNSSFSFPEKFGDIRLVSFEGEAYFDIRKSKKPFIIKTGQVDVAVLGTAFNLTNTGEFVELYVDRGLVAFVNEDKQTQVKAGLKAVFDKTSGFVEITENPSPNIMSWRNGIFKFDDTPLKQALKELSDYYQFEFKFQNDQVGKCKITATFDQSSLSDVINTIESILDVKIMRKESLIKISGKGC